VLVERGPDRQERARLRTVRRRDKRGMRSRRSRSLQYPFATAWGSAVALERVLSHAPLPVKSASRSATRTTGAPRRWSAGSPEPRHSARATWRGSQTGGRCPIGSPDGDAERRPVLPGLEAAEGRKRSSLVRVGRNGSGAARWTAAPARGRCSGVRWRRPGHGPHAGASKETSDPWCLAVRSRWNSAP